MLLPCVSLPVWFCAYEDVVWLGRAEVEAIGIIKIFNVGS